MTSNEVINKLKADGWYEFSCKGSHHTFRHPIKKGHITVPHPKKDLGKGLALKLLKAADLK
jgi:predicted RNA binding protein YcfA (HicA-like mRNA interferase family)